MDKRQAAEQLRRALQMFAATLTEEQALEIATVYPVWEPGKAYTVGNIISYGTNTTGDPQLYKVVQAHTSQADWPMDQVPALYVPLGTTAEEPEAVPEWRQPTGGHDAYQTGDRVLYQGKLYESTMDGNVWAPDTYGWREIER